MQLLSQSILFVPLNRTIKYIALYLDLGYFKDNWNVQISRFSCSNRRSEFSFSKAWHRYPRSPLFPARRLEPPTIKRYIHLSKPSNKEDQFAKLGLHDRFCSSLKRLGFEAPTEIQTIAIPKIFSGNPFVWCPLSFYISFLERYSGHYSFIRNYYIDVHILFGCSCY